MATVTVEVIYRNKRDTLRIAEIDGKFYPYLWDEKAGQCRSLDSASFANHSIQGVKYVARQYDTLQKAKKAASPLN